MTQNQGRTQSSGVDHVNASPGEEPSAGDRSRVVAEALEVADLNALRMTLLQLTGDLELRNIPLESVPIRSGRVWQTVVHHDYQGRLKELAADYLSREVTADAPPPARQTVADLINHFSGSELAGPELLMATENLALTEFPEGISAGLNPGTKIPGDFHVTVIGGGITGIAVAIYLKRLGIKFTVVERQPRFGGTWVANHYPGLRVDVSGFVYQYRFAPYRWRNHYPTQADVLEYIDYVVDRYDLRPDARLNTSVEEADWDEASRRWTVRLDDGTTLSSNIVISASGLFNMPHTPDIIGLSLFGGAMFHTANWDNDCSVDGKVVALIGNGSSGTQVMPWLAAHASKVYAFQRTANWIVPAVEVYREKVPESLYWLFENLPYYRNWHLYSQQETSVKIQDGQELDPAWYAEHGTLSKHNDTLRKSLEEYIAKKLEGRPDLIEKSTPKQAPLSRRLIVDNGWYDSLMRPNVELVTEPISTMCESGIITANGRKFELDAVVLGSGFEVSRYFWPVTFKGAAGLSLEDAWRRDGARAYLGMNHPDFPNFFSCYGPNGHPRSGGFHSWAEAWARYVTSLIVVMLNRGAQTIEVRREPFAKFNEALDEQFKSVVWGAVPSGGYYINSHGRPGVHMPFRSQDYYHMLANPQLSDYEFR